MQLDHVAASSDTHPKFNIAPEKSWLEDYLLLGGHYIFIGGIPYTVNLRFPLLLGGGHTQDNYHFSQNHGSGKLP